MNKKLIAAAISAAVVVPAASQADVTVYGNITNALEFENRDDEANPNDTEQEYSSTDVSGVGSRLGVRASSDLGNGLTAKGVYELAISSDDTAGFGGARVATVGLSGGFGSVDIGQQWSSFYNAIGSHISPNYTVSVGYGGNFRTGNTLKYGNSFGPVSLGVDIRVDDDEGDGRDAQGDGFGIGVTFAPTSNITIGVAYDASEGAEIGRPAVEAEPGTGFNGDGDFAAVIAEQKAAYDNLVTENNNLITQYEALLTARMHSATTLNFDPDDLSEAEKAMVEADPFVMVPRDMYDATAMTTFIEAQKRLADANENAAEHLDEFVPGTDAIAPVQDMPDSETFGVAVKATFGNFWGSVGYQSVEIDRVDQINCIVDDSTPIVEGHDDFGDIAENMEAVAAGALPVNDVGLAPSCSGLTGYVGDPEVVIPGAAGRGEISIDYVQLWVGGSIGEKTTWNVGFGTQTREQENNPNDTETGNVAFAVNHHMGGGLRLFLEHQDTTVEVDNMNEDVDTSRTLVGMRLNF